ncbi:MAG: hypothetical protein KC912_12150 [Proteobacteria bacterium]|nr:hypothetical protein [Pseudomonadota bacterium]
MRSLPPILFTALLLGCPPSDDPGDSPVDSVGDSAVNDSGDSTDSTPDYALDSFSDGGSTATVTCEDPDAELRTYVISSGHPLRDDLPVGAVVTVVEQPGAMRLRSGRLLLDGLFAMAMQEVRENSVEQIEDGAFEGAVDCSCFETGEKWSWVWTRDIGYAVEHSLAMVDPTRSKNSLLFKISNRKDSAGGGHPTLVQDTGSGGSWPVSTDRAVWALGAWELLKFLDGAERTAFRDTAYEAIVNTIDEDRVYIYDATDGLYRGEQSFLDWREQSYPSWTADDTVHIGMSKTLSTNIAHWRMLHVASELAAEKGKGTASLKYAGWRDELGLAIDREFWLLEDSLYSAMKTTHLDDAPVRKFDLLGESLAGLWLADDRRVVDMVEAYPHAPAGPPVLWPQQPFVPVYHNRAVWPFVTAYDLRASRRAGNSEVFDHDVHSLVRGAALNLSNMENFEFLTGANWYLDGDYSGPVVNSRRQLWSVAGFVAMVTRGIVGIEATQTGLSIEPFVTSGLRNGWLAESDSLVLHDVPYRGALIDVTIDLPAASDEEGAYAVSSVDFDGGGVLGSSFAPSAGDHEVRVTLGAMQPSAGGLREVVDGDFTQLWAPKEPQITALTSDGTHLILGLDASGESGVTFSVFRDGRRVASQLTGTTWTDIGSDPGISHCYALESEFGSGNVSHHSPPRCWWGSSDERVQGVEASSFSAQGGTLVNNWGREHYEGWGAPSDTLDMSITAGTTGPHLLQLTYGNGAGAVSTGITTAHKWLQVRDASSRLVSEGPVVMPHLGTWDAWQDSSFVRADLVVGQTYTVRVSEAPNMSYLDRHTLYRSEGGGDQTRNFVNIAELKVLSLTK